MTTVAWHDLGAAPGTCTICSAVDTLMLGEARTRLSLLERLRGERCPPPARFVTCRDCGWRWSVRAGDRSSDGARRRTGVERPATRVVDSLRGLVTSPPPVDDAREQPSAAARTVLPQPREGRRFSRD